MEVAVRMNSSLISKIEKARRYSQEHDRITIDELRCQVRGDNSTHTVRLGNGAWDCDCRFFADYRTCSHTMALQRILNEMLPAAARPASSAA